ncbi:MAG: hypothetical protein AABY22_34415 [Nanoarchaeota archaeon]
MGLASDEAFIFELEDEDKMYIALVCIADEYGRDYFLRIFNTNDNCSEFKLKKVLARKLIEGIKKVYKV